MSIHVKTATALIAAGAFAAVLAMGPQSTFAQDAEAAATEKCFGVAKAGGNDCAGNGHGCGGMSTADSDSGEFVTVPAGTCDKLVGGSTETSES